MFDSAGFVALVDRTHSPVPLIPIVLGVVKMCSRVASRLLRGSGRGASCPTLVPGTVSWPEHSTLGRFLIVRVSIWSWYSAIVLPHGHCGPMLSVLLGPQAVFL